MDRDELLRQLDQLIAEAKNERCFGDTSDNLTALRHDYIIGCNEAQMFDENTLSDIEEYTAAAYGERCREAAAITKEGRR